MRPQQTRLPTWGRAKVRGGRRVGVGGGEGHENVPSLERGAYWRHVYAHACIHEELRTRACTHTHTHVCVCVCVCVRMYACTRAFACVCIHTYACMQYILIQTYVPAPLTRPEDGGRGTALIVYRRNRRVHPRLHCRWRIAPSLYIHEHALYYYSSFPIYT